MLKPTGARAGLSGRRSRFTWSPPPLVFNHALVLPLSEPLISGAAALAAMVGYRFMVADRDRRLLQKSFALYLAPHVIDRMLASNKLPVLGGETRHVTAFFSDLEGFSLIAENMSPEALMALMNEYLSEMTDIIESHGGYVDKYIGDSIVAVFGAPADDPTMPAMRHARRSTVARGWPNSIAPAVFRGHKLAQRIGINSGDALVGNFGSRRRFNYSVMSDAVNLASRLEGANKFYGTTMIASETTVALAGGTLCLARTRHHQGQGTNPGAEDLRTGSALGRAHVLAAGIDRQLRRRTCALARPRIRTSCDVLWPFGRQRPAGIVVLQARPGIGSKPAGGGLGPDPNAAGEMIAER